MTEAELQARVIVLARKMRLEIFHSTDSRRDIGCGFPDLIIVGPKGHIARELKGETGYLSPQQQRWKYALKAAGFDWAIWRPEDLNTGFIEADLNRIA